MAISASAVGDTQLDGSPHGMTPSMVSTGDIRRLDRDLVELASWCDILVHGQAVPEHHIAHSHSHTEPSETARIAREAGCRTLLLTHFMSKINAELDAAVQTVQENFSGRV